jgi:hypothetical protein
MIETPDAMLWVARMRAESQRTYMHCLRVALHLIALGRHIGFPREDLVRLGLVGMLADVGKIRVPRALLDKPGLLTPSEFEVVKLHVQLGIDALRKSMALDPRVEQGIAEHHERIDGSGYPKGLEGRHISIFGRMTAIADCFAALTTRRPYAPAQSAQDAMMNLYKCCANCSTPTTGSLSSRAKKSGSSSRGCPHHRLPNSPPIPFSNRCAGKSSARKPAAAREKAAELGCSPLLAGPARCRRAASVLRPFSVPPMPREPVMSARSRPRSRH